MKNNDIFKKIPLTNKNIYLQINRTKTYLSDEKNITKEYDTCIAKSKNKSIVAGNKNVKYLNDPISFDWFIENDKITNFNVASFFFKKNYHTIIKQIIDLIYLQNTKYLPHIIQI